MRFALLAVTVALGAALLPAVPAEAQTATTLVKNTGQTVVGSSSLGQTQPKRAQAFTTGSSADGYRLTSIGVEFDSITGLSTLGSWLTVTVNRVSGSDPGDVVCTLAHPATHVANALNTYDASACPTLDPGTSYFVVLGRTDSGTSLLTNVVRIDRTTSTSDDTGAAAGWSIADTRHFFSSGSWSSSAGAHLIEVKGSAIVPPPRVTGFALDGDNDNPKGIWGNDETIWVSQSGTTGKLFAYNRSDGSRNSGEDFNTLSAAGNDAPTGLCSDGTTMFVVDWADNKVYAYDLVSKARDSTKDITLAAANTKSEGLWCNADTVWVAEDDFTGSNDIFAYNRADGTANTDVDFPALDPTVDGSALNANPRGIWSDGTTMFVVDDEDATVYAWKMADQTRDSDKEIGLDAANADPEGLWFDGRVLWVIDDADDRVYAYDLQGAQSGNTVADGVPEVRTHTTEDAWTATVTAGSNVVGVGYITTLDPDVGSLSPAATFTVDEVTYTVGNLWDSSATANDGTLNLNLDKEFPRGFAFSVAGESFSSSSSSRRPGVGGAVTYVWSDADLSWSATDSISVVLSADSVPEQGVEVTADVSGIRDVTDGLENVFFHYQWIRVDGTTETELAGETAATYTPTADDVDKHLKVRVIFDDDAGNRERPRTSRQVGPVVGLTEVTVDFEFASYSVDEGDSATVKVVLSEDPKREVVVPLVVINLGGASNSDYSGVPASVTFQSGETEQSFTFSATQDTDDDDDEGVGLRFGTLPAGVTGGESVAVSITDDDDPAVTVDFEHGSYSVAEGDSVTVKVKLSAVPERTVTVPITRTNESGASSSDYSGVPASVTFASVDMEKSFTFTATQDTVDDDGERVRLGFGTLPAGVTAGTTDVATVNITDNDDPAVTVSFEHGSYSVAEGDSVTVKVRLSAVPERTVTVPISRTNESGASSSDYSGVPASVTFASVDTEKSFTFLATQDSDDDDGERVRLGFGTLPARVTAGTTGVAVVSITDDDGPVGANNPGAPTVSVRADRSTITAGDRVMLYSIAGDPDGDDNYLSYAWTSDGGGTFTKPRFPDTRWSAPATATAGTVNLTLTVTDSDGLSASATVSVEVVAALAGANDPGVTITPTQLTVAEGATATYTVVLVRQPTANVRVSLQPQSVGVTGRSVLLDTYSVEFTTTSWNIPRTVTVDAIPDGDGDDDVVPIRHKIAASSAPEYRGLDIDTLSVTVTDPDAAPKAVLTISTRDQDVAEGGSVTITVNIDRAPDYSGGANVRVGLDYAQGLVTGTGHNNPVQVRSPWGTGGTPWATESTYVDLVFAGADTSKSFTISVRDDSVRSPAGSRRIIVGIIGSITDGVVKGTRTVVYIHVPEDD